MAGIGDIGELIAAARDGSTRAAGRLLSLVESARRDEVLAALGSSTARVIGITGPPGAGKSTTIAVLVSAYRTQGLRVAVLAVDPSSPYSGGALLGDRIRMAAHINDPGVLIRSVASRGHLGGLAAAVPAAIRVLAELGYDAVLLETVGVGQSEIEIAAVADPTVVILNPGAGDAVQAAKAGLLEVADIVVVNKADREGADQTMRDLRAETDAPILSLVASQGEGVPELVEAIDAHYRNDTSARRAARARAQILSLAQSRLRTHPDLERLAASVAAGEQDAYAASGSLLGEGSEILPARMTPSWYAAHSPAASAIVMGTSGEVVTYAELDERSTRFARALRTRRLQLGDHIAILMENNPAFLEVAWAAQRSGLYYTASTATCVRPRCSTCSTTAARRRSSQAPTMADRRRGSRSVADADSNVGGRCGPRLRALRRRARRRNRARRWSDETRGPGDAVLVGDDRAPEGRSQAAAGQRPSVTLARRPVHDRRGPGPHRTPRPSRSTSRPAPLYHAAPAGLLDVDAAARRDRRRDGAVRPCVRAWS